MPGLLLALVIVLGSLAPGTATAGQSGSCVDLDAYLTLAGERITEHVTSLYTDDDWVRSFESSSRKASDPTLGISALDEQELVPVLDLISVPGDALREIADEDVPPVARELHDSALGYHTVMPEVFTAVSKGGAIASMTYSDDLEAAAAANRSAQRAIREACPSLVEEIEAFAAANEVIDLNGALVNPDSLDAGLVETMDADGNRAVALSMLFFVEDEAAQEADASADAPPAQQADSGGEVSRSGIARMGDPAPDFEMTTFDGETFRLADHRGKVVIVNFWGSWCEPCREEMPAFQQAWEESGDDVIFVGVGSKRDPEDKAIAFAEEFGVTYPIGRDTEGGSPSNGEITTAYNIIVFPTTYIIDPEGTISAIVMFGMDTDDLAGFIDEARNP